jgi:hypothetical protein
MTSFASLRSSLLAVGITALVASLAGCSSVAASKTSASTRPGPPSRAVLTACRTSQLAIRFSQLTGAAGTGLYFFVATDTSRQHCSLGEYFHFAVHGANGRLLSNLDQPQPTTPIGSAVPRGASVPLRPGGQATTVVSIAETPVNGAVSCPAVVAFEVRPPAGATAVRVVIPLRSRGWFCEGVGSSINVFPTQGGPPRANDH